MAKRILVPLDRETEHEAILPIVADIARAGGATVRLVHVGATPDNIVNDDGLTVVYAGQEMQRIETEWRDGLLPAEVVLASIAVEHVVRFGQPVDEILAEAAKFHADLIVVTTTRRSVVRCGLLGSVADQLVRRAGPSVLVLRPAAA